jgi:hypothetical protein
VIASTLQTLAGAKLVYHQQGIHRRALVWTSSDDCRRISRSMPSVSAGFLGAYVSMLPSLSQQPVYFIRRIPDEIIIQGGVYRMTLTSRAMRALCVPPFASRMGGSP